MSFLRRELQDHVLTLTMSSPDTRNALTGAEQFDDFVQVCAEVNDDMSIRAVVLTGEGSAFCAGGNVKDMRDRAGRGVPAGHSAYSAGDTKPQRAHRRRGEWPSSRRWLRPCDDVRYPHSQQ